MSAISTLPKHKGCFSMFPVYSPDLSLWTFIVWQGLYHIFIQESYMFSCFEWGCVSAFYLIKYGWMWSAPFPHFQVWPLKFHQIPPIFPLPGCGVSSRESWGLDWRSLDPWLTAWSSPLKPHPSTCNGLSMKEPWSFSMLNNWHMGIITAPTITYPD